MEDLTPTQFAAWKACTAAEQVIDKALAAVGDLYRHGPEDTFNLPAQRHSVVCEVPATLDFEQACKWVHAITGRVAFGENNPLGQLRIDDSGAWFAQVAALGGTFKWVTPVERRARLDRLRAGTVRPAVDRSAALR